MRSLLEVSSTTDHTVDLADWVEISTFFNDDRSVSKEDLVRALVRAGGNRAEDVSREKASEAFEELSNRSEAMAQVGDLIPAAAYPFEVDGDLLTLMADPLDADGSGLVYTFLLAITRASMESTSRQLKGIDPTLVFEEVCAESICEFWGGRSKHSNVFVTGTSNKAVAGGKGRFKRIINDLSEHLHEGGGWKLGAKSPGAGDGGLDFAVWRGCGDKRPGGLIGFAQCKSGDHWRTHLGRHNPRSVCQRFFRTRFVLPPLPIYMVPCRVSLDEWEHVMDQHSGILFDRCRIAHFGTRLAPGVLDGCKTWLRTAIDRERDWLVKKGLKPAPVTGGGGP
jgi:hypothetical protein